jgi:hypothetical protein
MVHLQEPVDKMAKKTAGWKARWIAIPGGATWVKFVLAAMLMAIEFIKWLINKIEKLQRTFHNLGWLRYS